jgi:hypothetical protein
MLRLKYKAKKDQNHGVHLWCCTHGVSQQTVVKTCHRGYGVRTGTVYTGTGAVCEILPAV